MSAEGRGAARAQTIEQLLREAFDEGHSTAKRGHDPYGDGVYEGAREAFIVDLLAAQGTGDRPVLDTSRDAILEGATLIGTMVYDMTAGTERFEREPQSVSGAEPEKVREAIEKAVDGLFRNGQGDQAERLVLMSREGRDLGGWSRQPIVDCLLDALAALPASPGTCATEKVRKLKATGPFCVCGHQWGEHQWEGLGDCYAYLNGAREICQCRGFVEKLSTPPNVKEPAK